MSFISDFKQSNYFNRLFVNHNVIMIYLSGSRLSEIIDNRSDYDLMVIVEDTDDVNPPYEFLTYEDKKVHWYYRRISEFIETENSNETMKCFGNVLFANIKEDKIIYENKDYEEQIEVLKKNSSKIGILGCYTLHNTQKSLIEDILKEGNILEKHHTKFLYYLCYSYCLLTNETINTDFISKIKRIRWQPVSQDYKDLAVTKLTQLKTYITEHPINLSEEISNINDELLSNQTNTNE